MPTQYSFFLAHSSPSDGTQTKFHSLPLRLILRLKCPHSPLSFSLILLPQMGSRLSFTVTRVCHGVYRIHDSLCNGSQVSFSLILLPQMGPRLRYKISRVCHGVYGIHDSLLSRKAVLNLSERVLCSNCIYR
jgi:hypothetical protein